MRYLSDGTFLKYRNFIYDKFGINISQDKKEMLQSKLLKLIVKSRCESYEEYFRILTQGYDKESLFEFSNEITVNKTDFFRENNHFEFIKSSEDFIIDKNKRIRRNNEIRVWSAGCSTGEEAYTLSIVLLEHFLQGLNIKILGTDINSNVLKQAIEGVYSSTIKNNIDKYYLLKYFKKCERGWKASETIRRLVTFRLFNLMDDFPFKKSFDLIFCRNVMIYFDSKVQQRLIDKFYDVLVPGGILFIGHSESLTGKKHKFQYLKPTIYIK
ncbi:protein-glutamate O-methyltransferase CheR [Herbivorax sp. ANBcel31]|uniref:CheR family methyltransferase n=1 Tax=Herbivorax sp. ANBcel31 TaxID=3069754 RepID=UPI0027B269AF|nr:protein-glutamate O-methyltransferase CheR [Herbivorax sp. ANBcel31]MDQ2084910.1 protein-glutamate O-methyltransferase CheR [Herbivorax sp. ANBcel31]